MNTAVNTEEGRMMTVLLSLSSLLLCVCELSLGNESKAVGTISVKVSGENEQRERDI